MTEKTLTQMNVTKLRYFLIIPFLVLTVSVNSLYGQQSYRLILAGHKAIPKVQTSATGSIDVTLKNDSLIVEGTFENLTNYYFGSGIFYGEKDEQGNKIISLHPTIAENRIGGTFKKSENTFKLTEGQLEALAEGNLYINIMSFEHQRGELRAQLPAFKVD